MKDTEDVFGRTQMCIFTDVVLLSEQIIWLVISDRPKSNRKYNFRRLLLEQKRGH